MPPLIIGHRGAAGLEPENTLRSFQRALSIGVDAIETDVRLTRNGVPVCFHDESLERLTGHAVSIGSVTLEELKQMDVGQGAPVPTLADTIRVVRGRAALEIELKAPDSVDIVLRILEDERLGPGDVILTSFDVASLRRVRDERPDLTLSVLYRQLPADWLEAALRLGAQAVNLHFQAVTEQWVDKVHDARLLARTWTVNDVADMRRLAEIGVDGITTDRPDLVRQEFYRSSSSGKP